jgi:hypothetical protein
VFSVAPRRLRIRTQIAEDRRSDEGHLSRAIFAGMFATCAVGLEPPIGVELVAGAPVGEDRIGVFAYTHIP